MRLQDHFYKSVKNLLLHTQKNTQKIFYYEFTTLFLCNIITLLFVNKGLLLYTFSIKITRIIHVSKSSPIKRLLKNDNVCAQVICKALDFQILNLRLNGKYDIKSLTCEWNSDLRVHSSNSGYISI